MSPSKLTRRLEKVENRLTPPAREKVVVVIEYVSAETKRSYLPRPSKAVIGPLTPVEPPRQLKLAESRP